MQLNETPGFLELLQCTREGDLEKVSSLVENFSVELNCVDNYDYSPLILASLCGHIHIVRYLLQHGAILERDTFDGARCLYGALNDEIRNLLLKYDASTSIDLLQPFAAHLTALRRDTLPIATHDVQLRGTDSSLNAHKFLLAARSPFFQSHIDLTTSAIIHLPLIRDILGLVHKYVYVDNLDTELSVEDLAQLLKVSSKLKIPVLQQYFFDADTKSKRERQQDQSRRAQEDLEAYVRAHIIGRAWSIDAPPSEAFAIAEASMQKDPSILADTLIAVMDGSNCKIYPVHRCMLVRSEYYLTAFTSGFAEAHETVPHFTLETSPEVAELVLLFLYVDRVEIPRHLALDVLEIASFLLLSKERSLKSLAAISITNDDTALPPNIDVYDIIRIAWQTETVRVEQYAAKYIARNLDKYLYQEEFRDIIMESAARISNRQETDTIELLDDIRFYLSQEYGIYLEMNPVDERKPGELVKEDLWVPLTTYELQYNEQLAKLDDVLASLSLDA